MKRKFVQLFVAAALLGPNMVQADAIDDLISTAHLRVTGLDARASDIAGLRTSSVVNGQLDLDKLFAALFAHPDFIGNRVASFASRMSNEESEPYETVDDFQAAVILAVMNDIDFRNLLAKPFFIASSKNPGQPLEPGNLRYSVGMNDLREYPDIPKSLRLNFDLSLEASVVSGYYAEGIMTTKGFAKRSIADGTNRRPVRAAFNLFLCSKIETWKDASLDDYYVGRDVDRKPGKDPGRYQDNCRGCHAPMDSLRGATAYYDYDRVMDRVISGRNIPAKFNQNGDVYPGPGGYVTMNAQWENLLTTGAAQERFGWRGPTSGNGLLSFSKMISESRQFQTCMTQRWTAALCDLTEQEMGPILQSAEFKKIADEFRNDGYKTKTLVRKIALSGLCEK